MKQRIFTLLMLLALVFVAGSAFAQTSLTPYQGGKYSYTVSNISVTTATGAEATFSFNGFTTEPIVSEPSFTFSTDHYIVPSGTNNFTFKLEYDDDEPADAGNTITVTVAEGGGGCSNNITLTVTVIAKPAVTITLASATPGVCQAPLASPPTNGSADAYSGGANTVAFTVTTTTIPTDATITYALAITSGVTLTTDPSGTYTAVATHNAIFTTREGAGFSVAGVITPGTASFTMPESAGGGTYPMTIAGAPSISYGALPTIGTFN